MKKNVRDVLIVELIILIFILILKIVALNYFPYLINYINVFFWFVLAAILYLMFGFFKDKKYLKGITIRYIIIFLLSYLLFTYLLGLFLGFTNTVFSLKFIDIIRNVFLTSVIVVSREFVRYVICKKSGNNVKLVVILTTLYIIFDIIMSINITNFSNFEQIFMFIFMICVPAIAKESLCSYITYNISFVPTVIYVLAFEVYIYLFPIFPNLGNYIISILGLLFPFIIYSKISKLLKYNEKKKISFGKDFAKLFFVPIFAFITVIVVLISGIFSYKMIAIGSDSMNPIYYLGDAVIYKKVEVDNIKEKDILVFEQKGVVITHRVKKIVEKGNLIYFQTKGDNNNSVDKILVSEEDVLGVVKYIVKYVGYPTIWLNELF